LETWEDDFNQWEVVVQWMTPYISARISFHVNSNSQIFSVLFQWIYTRIEDKPKNISHNKGETGKEISLSKSAITVVCHTSSL
jgi:hypothetical protein